jgi:hypothetical protein
VLPVIEDIRAAGISSLKGIAAELNSRGILTGRGGPLACDTCWRAHSGLAVNKKPAASVLPVYVQGTARAIDDVTFHLSLPNRV